MTPAPATGPAVLCVGGQDVARYVWEPELPLSSSPRPYLHPVRTLAGHTVTDAVPDSHPHQLGISVAAPDIDGRNFWGGRTFVPGHGPAWLDNHGIQQHQRWVRHTSTECAHILSWLESPGTTALLTELRSITGHRLGETAWELGIRTELTNVAGRPLPFRTPATQGRVGAGYGGVFWRGPAIDEAAIDQTVQVLSPAGTDVGSVHGKTAAWLAVTRTGPRTGQRTGPRSGPRSGTGDDSWTMLFVPADETTARDRWFVRARDYLGVGLSPAWDRPLVLEPGETIVRHLRVVVIDGAVSASAAARLAGGTRPAR